MIWTQRSSTGLCGSSHNWTWSLEVDQISESNCTPWHHQKSTEEHASGNREAFTDDDRWKANWWTTSWWERSRWKWNFEVWVFFSSGLRISHPRSVNYCVCDGEWRCSHTPCRTHIFMTHFLCVAHRHRVHAWLKVLAVRMSYLMFHPPSLQCAARSLRDHTPDIGVCTFIAELFPIRSRGSSALPHEHQRVWLPGRSRALHT